MDVISRGIVVAFFLATFSFGASDGMISGIVKDPAGAPFRGAFVRVQNPRTRITISVLSNKQGQYRVPGLPPGEYKLSATASGYGDDSRSVVKVSAGESVTTDLALQKGKVRWNDLTTYQGKVLLPEGKGKEILLDKCFACHQFQSRIAANAPRNAAGWAAAVKLMRVSIKYRMLRVTDQDAAEIVSYLEKNFGMSSTLPSPSDLPNYAETVRTVSDEALSMVYVDYEMPGQNHFPWSAAPDNKGNVWIPFFGAQNRIAKMDIATGAVEEFRVPFQDGAAGVHSAFPAPDGSVWLAEQGTNRLGRWDPVTRKITEFLDDEGRGSVTVRVNAQGDVWSTGKFSRLDFKTGKFAHYAELPATYGMTLDQDGNAWASILGDGARNSNVASIARVDAKTGNVKLWTPPTPKSLPRRLAADSEGFIWFGEYGPGKLARFDPKTETFKEYQLPGASPKPYALAVDRSNRLWYSSMDMNVVGCLDPKTGKVVEYPAPYPENTMREFFLDAQGRMWFGTPANNRVGYFIPANLK